MPHTRQPIQSTFVNNRISFSNFWGKSTGFPGAPKSPQIGKIRNGIPQNRYFGFPPKRGKNTTVFGIDLSIDGKILMECSDHLWDYVTTLMRESLKQHKLAGALHMTITG